VKRPVHIYSSSHVNSLRLFYILLKILEVSMCILFMSSLLRNLSIYNYWNLFLIFLIWRRLRFCLMCVERQDSLGVQL